MLTPEYLDGIAEPIQALYSEMEIKIMADIARRIAGADYVMTPSAEWQIYKLQQMGLAQEYINQEVAKSLKISEKTLNEIFKNAGIKSMKTDIATQRATIDEGKLPENMIPLSASASFSQVINANAIRTHQTMKKLTGTIAIDVNGKINKYMDMCQLMVQSGAFTQQAAINVAVRRFSAEGVGCFDYISGVQTSIEAAVRRACITGVNQATAEVSLNNAEELETDLVEITSHADARPDHAEWQGKIYSISGKSNKYRKLSEATGYGTVSGLCGANCRHSFYAFIEGVSEKVKPEKYDQETYENEQKQRHNEKMIRYWKKRAATLQAGGVDSSAAKKKVSEWQAKQRAFLAETGLTRDYNREQIRGGNVLKELKQGIGQGKKGKIAPKPDPIQIDNMAEKFKNIYKKWDRKDIKTLASELVKIDGGADISHIKVQCHPLMANGQCMLDWGGPLINTRSYELKSDDLRDMDYRVKTAFHELYHAKSHGLPHTMTNNTDFKDWAFIDDVFAESWSHYMTKSIGIEKEISPSYADHLVKALPILKQLPEFSNCSTIADFGKAAQKFRFTGNATADWIQINDLIKSNNFDRISYSKAYIPYIKDRKDELVDKFLENMPNYIAYRSNMLKDVDTAISDISSGQWPQGNEGVVFGQVLILSMNRLGVK